MKTALVVICMAVLMSGFAAKTWAKSKGPTGYVTLYEDKNYTGRTVKVAFNKNIPNLKDLGFNDMASSLKYKVPAGWMVTLHADTSYNGSKYDMSPGSGNDPNLSGFEDKCSSVEWHRIAQ